MPKFNIGDYVENEVFDIESQQYTIVKGHIGGIQTTTIKNNKNIYYGIVIDKNWSEEGKKEFDNKYNNEWEYFMGEEHPMVALVWSAEENIKLYGK